MQPIDELETIYRRHAPALLRFAWGLSGDRARAEDIVSETFVRVLTRAPRIETRTAYAYLLVVARNIFLDGLGRLRREVALPEQWAADERDIVSRLDDRERLENVIEALAGIPEGERSAFLLRVDHELSYEEIASALGISVVAAKVRVHRARVRLASASGREGRTT